MIRVHPEESPQHAFRRFKRAVERDGLMGELRRRQYYRGPGARRRDKERRARVRRAKMEAAR